MKKSSINTNDLEKFAENYIVIKGKDGKETPFRFNKRQRNLLKFLAERGYVDSKG